MIHIRYFSGLTASSPCSDQVHFSPPSMLLQTSSSKSEDIVLTKRSSIVKLQEILVDLALHKLGD